MSLHRHWLTLLQLQEFYLLHSSATSAKRPEAELLRSPNLEFLWRFGAPWTSIPRFTRTAMNRCSPKKQAFSCLINAWTTNACLTSQTFYLYSEYRHWIKPKNVCKPQNKKVWPKNWISKKNWYISLEDDKNILSISNLQHLHFDCLCALHATSA